MKELKRIGYSIVLILILLLSFPSYGISAQVTRTGSVTTIQNSSQSGSQSITVPADATLCVVMASLWRNQANWIAANPVTLNGVNLTTLQKTDVVSSNDHTWLGYLVNPATGSRTLAWNWGMVLDEGAIICVVFYKGVDTSSPVVSSATQTTNGADLTTGLTAGVGDMMVGVVAGTAQFTSVTDQGGTQLALSGPFNNKCGGFAQKLGGTGFYFTGGSYTTISAGVFRGTGASVNQFTYSNTNSITIRDNNTANPYPSTITVPSVSGTVTKVTVTINGLSHTYPEDIRMLLVGPTGQNLFFMGEKGGGNAVSEVNLTFDDSTASELPEDTQIFSGRYRPSPSYTQYNFPSPAPQRPPDYGTTLYGFTEVDPAGDWKLYVWDWSSGDSGSISGGWQLTLTVVSGTTRVYYAVGQNTTDHKTGSPTVTISNGTATFSEAQTATNMGVGDRVTYGGSTIAYISGKISTTQWTLVTATGGKPPDVGTPTTVNSIRHEYDSLFAAEAGAGDVSHLNTTNLVTGDYVLNIPCYYDTGADATAVTINGWTTGANNYINIYTPQNISAECNQSQRHSGMWDGSKYSIQTAQSPIQIGASGAGAGNVRIEGLQIYSTSITSNGNGGIIIDQTAAADHRISNNIIRGVTSTFWSEGIYAYVAAAGSVVRIWNNIVYDFTGTNGNGIQFDGANFTSYVYNNTVYNCKYGYNRSAGTVIGKNNIYRSNGISGADGYSGTFSAGSDYNSSNISGDAPVVSPRVNTVSPWYSGATTDANIFVAPAATPRDLHLLSSAIFLNIGVDLSSDANLAFSDDIEGHSRFFGSAWDIGADEYVDGKFEYRRKITLNCSGKGASCGASGPSNFPVLIDTTNWPQEYKDKLKTVAKSGHVYRSDGGDIIFRDSSEVNQLPHEIEKYDGSTGTLIAWVKVNPLFNLCPTGTDIYIYYGNAGITSSTENPTGVWDAGYKAVWHLKETAGGSGAIKDSTSYVNHGTDSGGPILGATGKIGGAIEFDGSNDVIKIDNSSGSGHVLDLTAGPFTISAWFNIPYSQNTTMVGKRDNSMDQYQFGPGPLPDVFFRAGGEYGYGSTLSLNTWYYYAVVVDASGNPNLYKNGTLDTWTDQLGTRPYTFTHVACDVTIGARWTTEPTTTTNMGGLIDEVRISNVARDLCWIRTEYNNQSNPGTFSTPDTTEGSAGPTAVKLKTFNATAYEAGVLLQWRTGFEVDNLGFHVYREENGQLIRLTPEPVAGSALLAGSRTALTAGHHYHWWDASLSPVRYWLEDIDLSGKRTMHGPVTPVFSREPLPEKFSPELLSERGMRLEERYRHYWKVRELKEKLKYSVINRQWSRTNGHRAIRLRSGNKVPLRSGPMGLEVRGFQRHPDPATNEVQRYLAARSAVKIFVREEGWYRVTQSELVTAGLNSKINPHFLHLYADGKEQPVRIIGQGTKFDAIEFYGVGLDTPSTDTRVYWFVEGHKPGKRIHEFKSHSGSLETLSSLSFPYTVQVKDRWIYLPAIKNGEEENFFGAVVYGGGVDQLLNVQHLDPEPSEDALLEVVLQGATSGPHRVRVLVNNNEVGEIAFEGQSRGVLQGEVPHSLLLEGDNLVSFIPLGGEMDVSLVDTIRLTYWHTYTADDNGLRLTAQGSEQLSIEGFRNSGIRVFDITEPKDVIEVIGKVESQKGSYAISFRVPGHDQRTLLALTEEKVKTPEGVVANQPSSWHQSRDSYDLVIVTHRDFFDTLQPLKKLRESQGLRVALIDVEDLYDEFSFGNKSPKAIKDFLASAKSNWRRTPRFVLLVGDASFDPKNYFGLGDFDFVPTKLVDTVYMETASDDWFVDLNGDGLPEMAIGRLPVQTKDEAAIVVSKIVGYEKSSKKNEALLVADRVDNSDDFNFEGATEEIRALLPSSLMVRKIYRGQFSSDSQANGVLLSAINQGPLLVNFIGHGSIEIWRGILTSEDAEGLINGMQLPFFVNMTCLNGYFQDPYSETLGEVLLKAKGGGAIAVWTSSGLTEPDKQAVMNKELVKLLFGRGSLTLGEATAKAKKVVSDQDIRRTWILFGDPTTRLK